MTPYVIIHQTSHKQDDGTWCISHRYISGGTMQAPEWTHDRDKALPWRSRRQATYMVERLKRDHALPAATERDEEVYFMGGGPLPFATR